MRSGVSLSDARNALKNKGLIRPKSPDAKRAPPKTTAVATATIIKIPGSGPVVTVPADKLLMELSLGELNETPVADINEDAVNPNDDLLVPPAPGKPVPSAIARAELDHHDHTNRAQMLRVACCHAGLAEALDYYYNKRPVPFLPGIKLRVYQMQALNWMALRESHAVHGINGGILGPEMGLGKTLIASAFVLWSKRPKEGPTLIIASLNVLKEWQNHFAKFYDTEQLKGRVVYLHRRFNDNTDTVTAKDLEKADIVLTTYDMMRASYRSLVKNYPDDANSCIQYVNEETQKKIFAFHVRKASDVRTSPAKRFRGVELIHQGMLWGRLMLDESQTAANPSKKTFRAAMAIAAPYRWGITGTIIRNYVYDIWAQMRIIGYDKVPAKKMWTRNSAPRYYRNHQLSSVIYALTYEQAGITLPPFEEVSIKVALTARERTVYELVEAKARAVYLQAAQKTIDPGSVRVMIMRLRQCVIAASLMNAHGAIDGALEDFDDALEGMFEAGEAASDELESNDDDNDDAEGGEEDEDDQDDKEGDNDSSASTPSPATRGKKRALDSADDSEKDASKRRRTSENSDVSQGSSSNSSSAEPPAFKTPKQAIHFCVDTEGEGGIHSSKMKAILGAIETHLNRGPEHKIICFSMWSSSLSLLVKAAAAHPTLGSVNAVQVDGSVKGDDRDALFKRFKDDPSVRILAIQGTIGSEGLNLQHATGGLQMEPHWTLQTKKQQRRRFWRVGQDKPTWWYDVIVENSIDQRVLEICNEKIKIEEEFKNKKRRARTADADLDTYGRLLGVTSK